MTSAGSLALLFGGAALAVGVILLWNARQVKWVDVLLWAAFKPVFFLFCAFGAIEVTFRILGPARMAALALYAEQVKGMGGSINAMLESAAWISLIILGVLAFAGYTIDALAGVRSAVKSIKKILEPVATAALVFSSVALAGPSAAISVHDVQIAQETSSGKQLASDATPSPAPTLPADVEAAINTEAATLEAATAEALIDQLSPAARDRLHTYSRDYTDAWDQASPSWEFRWQTEISDPIGTLGAMLHDRFEAQVMAAHNYRLTGSWAQFRIRRLGRQDEAWNYERVLVSDLLSRIVDKNVSLDTGNALGNHVAESEISDKTASIIDNIVNHVFNIATHQKTVLPRDLFNGVSVQQTAYVAAVVSAFTKQRPGQYTVDEARIELQRRTDAEEKERQQEEERAREAEPHMH